MKVSQEKSYLGDGVYAQTKPGHLIITTENGINATNVIYFEDEVILALFNYIKINDPELFKILIR